MVVLVTLVLVDDCGVLDGGFLNLSFSIVSLVFFFFKDLWILVNFYYYLFYVCDFCWFLR